MNRIRGNKDDVGTTGKAQSIQQEMIRYDDYLAVESEVNLNLKYAYCAEISDQLTQRRTRDISTDGTLLIWNGNVIARASSGAGIGSGYATQGAATVGSSLIYNRRISATASSCGAGIGSGLANADGIWLVETISILNGVISASSSSGAGIRGYAQSGVSTVGALLISGGSITASAAGAAGIGGGYALGSSRAVSVSSIVTSSIWFSATWTVRGAAIGAGGWNTTSPFIDIANLRIINGRFLLSSNSGAGSLELGSMSNLTIGSPHIDYRSLGTNTSPRELSLLFNNGSVTALTGASNLSEFSTIAFSGSPDLFTIYTGRSNGELFTGLPVIHVGSVECPCKHLDQMKVWGSDASHADLERSTVLNANSDIGFGASVPSIGNYRIGYSSTQGSSHGSLMQAESILILLLRPRLTHFTGMLQQPVEHRYALWERKSSDLGNLTRIVNGGE